MAQSKSCYHILFISHYSEMYGANKSMYQLILELKTKYNIIPFVLLPRQGSICSLLDEAGIEYQISHYYWWVNNETGLFQKILNVRKQFINAFRAKKLAYLFKNKSIDLVYSNSITINIGYYISKHLNTPHIWHLRETLDAYNFKFSLGNTFAKFLLRKGATKYIVISDFVLRNYLHKIPIEKTIKIYNGISINQEHIKKITPNDGKFHICCVGIISNDKNQVEIIEALRILKDKKMTNIRLHLIGQSVNSYLETIQEKIEEYSLNEMVIFHGHQNDVSTYLNKMDVGIICSRNEGFGRVTIEYMLHYLPVIASNSGANAELVTDNVNGLLYCIDKPEELAEKIEYLSKHRAVTELLGKTANHFAKTHFSSKQNAEKIATLISSTINQKFQV